MFSVTDISTVCNDFLHWSYKSYLYTYIVHNDVVRAQLISVADIHHYMYLQYYTTCGHWPLGPDLVPAVEIDANIYQTLPQLLLTIILASSERLKLFGFPIF